MKRRKYVYAATVLALIVFLAGCGKDGTAVYVQSVSSLSVMGGIAPGDRFAGIVVSEMWLKSKETVRKPSKNFW